MAVRVGRRPERGPNWKRFVLCSPPSPGDGGQAGLYRYHLPEQKSYDLQPFPSPFCVTAQSTNRMLKECEENSYWRGLSLWPWALTTKDPPRPACSQKKERRKKKGVTPPPTSPVVPSRLQSNCQLLTDKLLTANC